RDPGGVDQRRDPGDERQNAEEDAAKDDEDGLGAVILDRGRGRLVRSALIGATLIWPPLIRAALVRTTLLRTPVRSPRRRVPLLTLTWGPLALVPLRGRILIVSCHLRASPPQHHSASRRTAPQVSDKCRSSSAIRRRLIIS